MVQKSSNREHFLSFNCVNSRVDQVTCGASHGSVLGTVLFLIYVNGLSKCLLQAILFADDATVYMSSRNLSCPIKTINEEVAILSDWFNSINLSLNISKSNYITCSQKHQHCENNISIDGHQISHKSSVKFQGVIVDQYLSWEDHSKYCKTKIISALFVLKSSRKFISEETAKMLDYILIYSRLNYGILL